jgi:prepilin-type N-terminal cleavage/methylation domain-containing protein
MARPDNSRGFSLIEMLIAVAIASVVLTGVMRLFSTSLAGASRADAYAQATLLAQSKLEAMGGTILTTVSDAEGSEGSFRWRSSIHRYGDPTAGLGASYLLPYEVAVSVSWIETGRERSLTLRSLRLGPQG